MRPRRDGDREAVELLEYCYALECALVDGATPGERGRAIEVVYALRDMFAPTVGRDMPSWEGRA